MASTSQQQIPSQSSVLFKFEVPNYDDGIAGLNRLNGEFAAMANDKLSGTSNAGITTPFAGLLGPSSKAPKLVPISSAPIDIKNNFAWTSSKADPARADMPYVYLTEKIVDRSSRLQNLMYSTVSLLQSPFGIAAGAAIGAAAGSSLGGSAAATIGAKGKLATGLKIGGAVVGGVAGAGAASSAFSESTLGGDVYTKNLKAFSGLYSTTPTNFSYKLPFVRTSGSINKGISQNWNEESNTIGSSLENINSKLEETVGSSAAEGLVGAASRGLGTAGLLAKAADDVNSMMSEANKNVFAAAYTESAKTFGYGGAPSFDISFYLFNNLTWADTVKNWYAVFGLQYQNLPNRLNRLILTPSVIYEAVVPGYFYSMYTYIKSLNVSFIGSNLLIDIPIIQTNTSDDSVRNASTNQAPSTESTIKVIMPEVYKIDITFESLVPESQNLLYEAMVQTRSNGSVPQSRATGQFGSAGVGLTPGIPAGSLGSIPLGF
jgi:hypothetical protein